MIAMQSVIVTLVVLVCLAAVVRSAWRQFSAKEGGGCGGCASAKGCSQPKTSPCATGKTAEPVQATVQWHTRRQAAD